MKKCIIRKEVNKQNNVGGDFIKMFFNCLDLVKFFLFRTFEMDATCERSLRSYLIYLIHTDLLNRFVI